MNLAVFIILGIITAIGSALMLFRFDGKWLKAISLTGGTSILLAECYVLIEFLSIQQNNKSTMIVALASSWLICFLFACFVLRKIFKNQATEYQIHMWEVILGDKKTIQQYYDSKKLEIEKKLEEEYDIKRLEKDKAAIEEARQQLAIRKKEAEMIIDDANEIIAKNYTLDIPVDHDFPIKSEFFELLPRYIQLISEFAHQLTSFTDTFITTINDKQNKPDESDLLRTYLFGVGCYVGQCLFEWRDVRVHFRYLNTSNNTYDKYLAFYKSGVDYYDNITPIPADTGLIAQAVKTKRSLVYSANREEAFDTGSKHIWKDYMTMVFEKINFDGKPVLSLGVSVKHRLDHRNMLYFLSYIQIEQVIQENLLKVVKNFSVTNAAFTEVV